VRLDTRKFLSLFLIVVSVLLFCLNNPQEVKSSAGGHHFFSGIVQEVTPEYLIINNRTYEFTPQTKFFEEYRYKNSIYQKPSSLNAVKEKAKVTVKAIGKSILEVYIENY